MAKSSANPVARLAIAGMMLALTAAMAVGIAAAAMGMWLPLMR